MNNQLLEHIQFSQDQHHTHPHSTGVTIQEHPQQLETKDNVDHAGLILLYLNLKHSMLSRKDNSTWISQNNNSQIAILKLVPDVMVVMKTMDLNMPQRMVSQLKPLIHIQLKMEHAKPQLVPTKMQVQDKLKPKMPMH